MNSSKLQKLAEIEGYDDPQDMLNDRICDSLVPAICSNPSCDYTQDMEPDQDKGWCPECEENTLKSCLILAGII